MSNEKKIQELNDDELDNVTGGTNTIVTCTSFSVFAIGSSKGVCPVPAQENTLPECSGCAHRGSTTEPCPNFASSGTGTCPTPLKQSYFKGTSGCAYCVKSSSWHY